MYRTLVKIAFLVVILLPVGVLAEGSVIKPTRPIVVELFTSQGCPACPPADRIIEQLAVQGEEKGNVLPLSFHVDLWDRKGWKDPFATPYTTSRHEVYAARDNKSYLYTPQIMVDGRYELRKTRGSAVVEKINHAMDDMRAIPIGFRPDGSKLDIKVGAANSGEHDIWLVTYDSRHQTSIESGIHRGRTVRNANVVKEIFLLGELADEALIITLELDKIRKTDNLAVIIQEKDWGRINGAASYRVGL